jgi:hypothetical protein
MSSTTTKQYQCHWFHWGAASMTLVDVSLQQANDMDKHELI